MPPGQVPYTRPRTLGPSLVASAADTAATRQPRQEAAPERANQLPCFVLADERPTVVFRCGQPSRLLTSAAAVASGKPRTRGLTAAPSSAQIALTYMRSVMSV